jgi:hypothetical protein
MPAFEVKVEEPIDESEEKSQKGHYHKGEGKLFKVDTFYEELIFETVSLSLDRKPIYRVWKYYQDTVPCISCQKTSDMCYNIQAVSGVYARCRWCNVTFPVPPADLETNLPNGTELISDTTIGLEDAYAIMNRIGQPKPNGFPPLRQRTRRHK